MSFSNSASQKLLRRATEDFEERELVKSESNLKKASTFPTDLPLDIALFGVEKAAYDGNPFLKARVKAYLQDLDKSASSIRIRK
jgi:hypothetical protein